MGASDTKIQWMLNVSCGALAATINNAAMQAAIAAAEANDPSYEIGLGDKKTLVNPVVDIVLT
jgi:hypothetical protein